MAEYRVVPITDLERFSRWDAEYFSPKPTELLAALRQVGARPLGTYIDKAQRGMAPNYDPAGSVPIIRTVNVRDLEFSATRQEYVTQSFYSSLSKGHVGELDIAVTSTGLGTLGRVFCNMGIQEYMADGHITVLSPKADADYAYLTAVLQSGVGQIQFEQWQRGSSGQIEIYPEDILSIMIPLLPISLQLEISELWKSAVNLVQRACLFYPEAEFELLDRIGWPALQNSKVELFFVENSAVLDNAGRVDAEHFQPKFRRLCQHLLDLKAVGLGTLCSSIDKGTQPGSYSSDGEIVVVKSKNVFGQGIDFGNCERTTSEVFADIHARLAEGDVVMNSTGLGTLGRAGFIPANHPEKMVASVDLLKLSLKHDEVLPEDLTLFLNCPAGLAQSEMFQTGSSGQLHLYPQHIQNILIFLPRNKDGSIDIAGQKKLADKVVGASVAKKEAQVKLAQAKRLVEEAISHG